MALYFVVSIINQFMCTHVTMISILEFSNKNNTIQTGSLAPTSR